MLRFLKWLLFATTACFLAWRMVILGMADFYAGQADAFDQALAWYPSHPSALAERALALADSDPIQAEPMLSKAIWANPADGRLYLALGRYWEQQGDSDKAAKLVTIAGDLAPMRDWVQLGAAEFWLRQGHLDKALAHWSVALDLRPSLRPHLYPILLRLAQNPETLPSFMAILKEPPEWWEDFFAYVADNAVSSDTARVFFKARQEGDHRPTDEEYRVYMARLQRDGQWLELYITWIGSLDAQRLSALGNLYDGGFELPFTNSGFDWYVKDVRGVKVETASTYGVRGNKALHVVFQGLRVRFRHLYQFLLLEPGRYRLRGWARPDGLQTENGLQWTISCAAGGVPLGSSERFLGTDQWRSFTVDFEVPEENCQVQLLRLELAGRAALDFEANGAAWFDGLAINRVEQEG